MAAPPTSAAPASLPWLAPLLALAGLAVALAVFHYFTGPDYALPLTAVTQLKPLPVALDSVRVGLAALPVRANVYLLTQTHDLGGPFVRPDAAAALLAVLAGALVYYLAAITRLARAPFVVGMALVIFLLMSLNTDQLGIFGEGQRQYFLILLLIALGLPAYGFHAFWPAVPLGRRLLAFALLVAGLSALLFARSLLSAQATALHLVSYSVLSGAVVVGLVVLWVGFENIYGLLWLNTRAETPGGRFGVLPFVVASSLYLSLLGLYYWNDGQVPLLFNVRLDPLVLLLPAVVVGWLGLRRRAASYGAAVPYGTAAYVYLALVALGAAVLGYALATVNNPLLDAARQFTALALLTCGAAFLLYVLVNFAPLIRRRLRVYLVAYQPRRLPLYTVYILGIGAIIAVEVRNQLFVLDQVQAGYYNELGDLTRLQSEEQPAVEALAFLAERYYAESDVLDRFNHKASLGRAALYHFRLQRQNELNALNRALSRAPSARISLRLAALYSEPKDFFDRQQALRDGLRHDPTSAPLASDMAQLYMRSTLADSVAYYLDRAATAAPGNAAVQTNTLAFLLLQQDWPAAQQWAAAHPAPAQQPARQSNELLLARLTGQPAPTVALPDTAAALTLPTFARLYHGALARATAHDTSLLPTLRHLSQRPANADYREQLTFLRALTLHDAGRLVAARTALRPLTIGTTPGAAYYQNLLGLWQLTQRQYPAAAATFAGAAQYGYPEAAVGRAYALALNNQPDSARAAVAAVPAAVLPSPTTLLRQTLALTYPAAFATASDTLQAQFLVVPGSLLPPAQQLALAAVIAAPAPRQAALLATAPRALAAGQLAAVATAVQQAAPAPATATPAGSAWNAVRGQLYLANKQWDDVRTLLQTAYFAPADQPQRLLLSALLAAHAAPAAAGAQFAALLREAPFDAPGVLAAAAYHTQRQDYPAAYDALLRGLDDNPASVELLKAYALATIPVGLAQYAAAPLQQLQALLSPAEYSIFHAQYEARRAALSAETAAWN